MDWQIIPRPDSCSIPGHGDMVALTGDFDLYEGPRFAAELLGHIRNGHNRLVLDLSAVDYLDSCGVGIIIKLLQEARLGGGKLQFQGIHGSPRRVLEMSHVIRLLDELPPQSADHRIAPAAGGGA